MLCYKSSFHLNPTIPHHKSEQLAYKLLYCLVNLDLPNPIPTKYFAINRLFYVIQIGSLNAFKNKGLTFRLGKRLFSEHFYSEAKERTLAI